MQLRQLFDTQYRVIRLRSASQATIKLWYIALSQFERFIRREPTTDDLTDQVVSEFAAWRRQCVSGASVNRDLASLLALWRFGCQQSLISKWPNVMLCKETRRVPIAWQREEVDRLMAAVQLLRCKVGDVPSRIWWRALLLVAFDTAERIHALLSLEVDDVDLNGQWIVFRAESRKGQREDSMCRISPQTASALQPMMPKRGVVFRWPYSPGYLWVRLTAILDSADLPTDRRRKFHAIRKTTASLVESNGGSATQILRHSNAQNTKSYLDPRYVKAPQAIDYLPWRPK